MEQSLWGAEFQTKTWSCSMLHLHVRAAAQCSGLCARSQDGPGVGSWPTFLGFLQRNTPTSVIPFPGLGFGVWSRAFSASQEMLGHGSRSHVPRLAHWPPAGQLAETRPLRRAEGGCRVMGFGPQWLKPALLLREASA